MQPQSVDHDGRQTMNTCKVIVYFAQMLLYLWLALYDRQNIYKPASNSVKLLKIYYLLLGITCQQAECTFNQPTNEVTTQIQTHTNADGRRIARKTMRNDNTIKYQRQKAFQQKAETITTGIVIMHKKQ